MTTIFLVDDHKLIRDGIKSHFEESPKYQVIGEAQSGEEALETLKTIKPDVVLMDINMGGMDGIACTQQIKESYPEMKVLALTMLAENQHIKEMLKAGASGYVLKNCTEDELKLAIDSAQRGQNYYSSEVTQVIMSSLTTNSMANPNRKSNRFATEFPLTQREKEVLRLIIKEYSNQEIADKLFISRRTVEAHKRNLLEKTGAKNVAGLVMFAVNNQIFEDL